MSLNFTKENLSISRILNISWTLFTQNFVPILYIILIVYLPINSILYIAELSAPEMGFTSYLKLINYLESLIGIIATLAIAILLMKKINNEEISYIDSISIGLKSYGNVIGVNIITGFMLLALTLLFIIPGVIYSIYWIFVTYIVLIHQKNSSDAREYSKNLVKGRWWKTFWYSFVFGVLATISIFLIGFLMGFIEGFGGVYLDTLVKGPSNDLLIYLDAILTILKNTIIDILYSFFTVISFILFIAYDETGKENEIVSNKVAVPESPEAGLTL